MPLGGVIEDGLTVSEEVADAVGVGVEPDVTSVSVIRTLTVSEPKVVAFPLKRQVVVDAGQIVTYGPEFASYFQLYANEPVPPEGVAVSVIDWPELNDNETGDMETEGAGSTIRDADDECAVEAGDAPDVTPVSVNIT